MKIFRKILITILVIIDITLIAFIVFLNQGYEAVDVDTYLTSNNTVEVVNDNKNIYFKPKTNDKQTGFIFYTGALVEKESYAPIMNGLARLGYTTVLVNMPYDLAFFGIDKAYDIAKDNDNIDWYIGGHSLGGAMASECYYKHSDIFKGLVLLAAYSTNDLTKNENSYILSLYGSNDCVLSKEKYEANYNNIKSKVYEYCIEGGNHAGFGSYGEQKGDGKSTITNKEQWSLTTDYIDQFMSHTFIKLSY